MPRARLRLALGAAALALLGAACSSSTTDPAENAGTSALTTSEAGTVATGLLTQASSAAAGGTGVTHNSDGSYTVQCPGGGTITGAINPTILDFTTNSDGSRNYVETVTLTPQACVVGTGARQIAITGDPSEVVQSTLTVAGTALLKSTSAVTGGFKWDGGSCQLNYTATTSLSGSTQTVTVTGTVCGQSVNRTTTF